MVFFDIEEHQIPTEGGHKILADIPKLGTQWKIIYELNSTECLQSGDPAKGTLGLGVIAGDPIHSGIFMGFLPPNVRLVHGIYEGPNSIQATPFLESSQLPEIGEWTGIEISHEEASGAQVFYLL